MAAQVGPMDMSKRLNVRMERANLSPNKGKFKVAKDVIMPALGMAQETGTLIQWLKAAGDSVTKGEPLMEIETDKATVEIEAPASGILVECHRSSWGCDSRWAADRPHPRAR